MRQYEDIMSSRGALASICLIEQERQMLIREIRSVIQLCYAELANQPGKVVFILRKPNVGNGFSLGNKIFLKIVLEQKDKFDRACDGLLKSMIAETIVDEFESQTPPIHFADQSAAGCYVVEPRASAIEIATMFLNVAASKLKGVPSVIGTPSSSASVDSPRSKLQPNDADVVFGIGCEKIESQGNKLFRKLVDITYFDKFARACTEVRQKIAETVMEELECSSSGMRILHRGLNRGGVFEFNLVEKRDAIREILNAFYWQLSRHKADAEDLIAVETTSAHTGDE
jgi:hypothetical protein